MFKPSSYLTALYLSVGALSVGACGSPDSGDKGDPQNSPDQTDPQAKDDHPEAEATVSGLSKAEEVLRSQGYHSTPGGLVHESCIHAVEEGDSVNDDGSIQRADGRLETFAACAYPVHASHGTATSVERTAPEDAPSEGPPPGQAAPDASDGWREWAQWVSPANIGYFSAQFHVPAAPRLYLAQVDYLFNGLGGSGASRGLIQPVLQYGAGPAGGGKYWSMASWFGGTPWGNHYYHSALMRVNTGEVITGTMRESNCIAAGCRWDIRTTESTHGGWTAISMRSKVAWRTVYAGVLEIHYGPYCTQYPATYDNFFNFDVRNTAGHRYVAPWTTEYSPDRKCGEVVSHNSNLLNLYYTLSNR